MILIGKGFEQWDDRTADEFRRALRTLVSSIEEAAISRCVGRSAAPLVESRLRHIYKMFEGIVGKEHAHAILDSIKHVKETA
jgi:hypothetical protein